MLSEADRLNKQLQERTCDSLKGRIQYYLTRYHDVHNSYGRASVRLDGHEMVNFSWVEVYKQDSDTGRIFDETGVWDYDAPELKAKWDAEGTFSDYDFLEAATDYLQLGIKDALDSDNYLIRMFAILDRRVGRRTLEAIKKSEAYREYPDWLRQFYELRINAM